MLVILILVVLILIYFSTRNENFTNIEINIDEINKRYQTNFDEYMRVKNDPSLLMPEGVGIEYTNALTEDEKLDCTNKCDWKMNDFCIVDGKYDPKCDSMFIIRDGLQYKSKGYQCGSDELPECDTKKCKSGTINGCKLSDLNKLVSIDTPPIDPTVSKQHSRSQLPPKDSTVSKQPRVSQTPPRVPTVSKQPRVSQTPPRVPTVSKQPKIDCTNKCFLKLKDECKKYNFKTKKYEYDESCKKSCVADEIGECNYDVCVEGTINTC